jgi:EAL domain-containing protein (putative c-di-GMP-specific phosphodiesterase class I)
VTLLSEARKPRRVAGGDLHGDRFCRSGFLSGRQRYGGIVVRCADITLFRVKRRGKNNVSFFSADDHDQALSHIDLESELRASVEAGFKDFEIYYQPTVDAVSGICNGAEALLRWTSPKNIRISPADVIMHLELIGCVEQVGDWVLEQAIGQCAAWRASGLSDFSIHVNLSMLQLRDHVLEDRLVSMLASSGLPPSSLVLEVTESAIMNDLSNSIAILNDIRRHGVRIALDDFGSGYSSINYLRKLPIDQIKIDRSLCCGHREYVQQISCQYDQGSGTRIQLSVCDEGIEDEAQFDQIEPSQGDIIQGYLFGKTDADRYLSDVPSRQQTQRGQTLASGV